MKLINRFHQKNLNFYHFTVLVQIGMAQCSCKYFNFALSSVFFLYRTYHVYYSYIFRADFTAKVSVLVWCKYFIHILLLEFQESKLLNFKND